MLPFPKTTHYPLPTTHSKVQKGFTLIELLIVISIIGILVAMGINSWQAAQIRARDDKRKTDLKVLQQAFEQYYQANGEYPYWPNGGTCWYTNNSGNWGVPSQISPYLTKLPKDPSQPTGTANDYLYCTPGGTDAFTYRLCAVLENPNDPDKKTSSCGSANYSYEVTNP